MSGGTLQGDPVAFAQLLAAGGENLISLIDADGLGADHAAFPHSAGNHRGMACHSPARSENPNRGLHAVNIIGDRFLPDQHDTALGSHLHCIVGREDNLATDGSWRCRQALSKFLHVRFRIEDGMQ